MLDLKHKNLELYQIALSMVQEVYKLTSKFPDTENFGLTLQIRRAALSVISNFSEGSSKPTPKDRKRFYQIARASLVEVDTQIEVSIKLEYISSIDTTHLSGLVNSLFALLSTFIKRTI